MDFLKLNFLFLLISATRLFGQTAPLDTAFLIDGSYITGEILNPGSENSIQIKNNEGAIIYIKNQRIEKRKGEKYKKTQKIINLIMIPQMGFRLT